MLQTLHPGREMFYDEIVAVLVFLQETKHMGAAHEEREAGGRQGGEQRDSAAVTSAVYFTCSTYVYSTYRYICNRRFTTEAFGRKGVGRNGRKMPMCVYNTYF